ncbi:MAG: helical backbone metal receptor [Chloroflexi bacterium]|nr:helical backbone metal receptor [Chloroflexota bacterium]
MSTQPADSSKEQYILGDLSQPPERVVSLVPSLTESFFDLDIGKYLVGVTDYCTRPGDQTKDLPRVGGPKDARLKDILALNPDLVLACQEENSPELVDRLRQAGIYVWVIFPQTVKQSLDVLWNLNTLYQNELGKMRLHMIEIALDWAQQAAESHAAWRYFCPIWMDESQKDEPAWMTFNAETYPADLLGALGGENVFANRRRIPESSQGSGASEEIDTRYPWVTCDEIRKTAPEVILLPDEPYAFTQVHREQIRELFADTPAVRDDRIILCDGSLITWYGTRLAHAIAELPNLIF